MNHFTEAMKDRAEEKKFSNTKMGFFISTLKYYAKWNMLLHIHCVTPQKKESFNLLQVNRKNSQG